MLIINIRLQVMIIIQQFNSLKINDNLNLIIQSVCVLRAKLQRYIPSFEFPVNTVHVLVKKKKKRTKG